MPEGDTVFRTARNLGRALVGKPVIGFRSTYPLLTRFNDDHPIAGQTVDCVEARGKWLLIYFSGGGILTSHLLMNGRWHIYRHGERWQLARIHMRIVIENGEYQAVGFRVPVARMHTAQSLERDLHIARAENDLLRAEFDAEAALVRLLARPGEAIADTLLDQAVLAGVGNVFKSEICFVQGLNPFRKAGTLTRDEAVAAIACARGLLKANVLEDSGDLIVTYRGQQRRTTHASDPGASLWVYGRAGEPCRRCGEEIRRRVQGADARVTFWCPSCQAMPDGSDVDG
ncbi:DNA-(Apurinic or apyrimidinic site) lyase [Candidatus Sulfotelmatomonas gaucii]|uniref:DNA-(apurinic or apyrimidinic site) lyase n=1 Tax=Candidatus Sulfuritelmatomonas gaucii TaxID=2043161 RepID=A0A2N9L963_9BACT|nr:DNA-(Apurinic or apyrimidinic site) lyase [Candidatus Sulfotelmatomonas gaucii]